MFFGLCRKPQFRFNHESLHTLMSMDPYDLINSNDLFDPKRNARVPLNYLLLARFNSMPW